MHMTSVFGWYIVRIAESMDGHCGYAFPWSPFKLLPLQGDEGYHAYHHSTNSGNYSSFFTLWDTVFGSNTDYHEDKRARLTRVKQD